MLNILVSLTREFNLSFSVTISIDYSCRTMLGDFLNILAVDMDMAVEMVAWFKDLDKPAEGLDPLVG